MRLINNHKTCNSLPHARRLTWLVRFVQCAEDRAVIDKKIVINHDNIMYFDINLLFLHYEYYRNEAGTIKVKLFLYKPISIITSRGHHNWFGRHSPPRALWAVLWVRCIYSWTVLRVRLWKGFKYLRKISFISFVGSGHYVPIMYVWNSHYSLLFSSPCNKMDVELNKSTKR